MYIFHDEVTDKISTNKALILVNATYSICGGDEVECWAAPVGIRQPIWLKPSDADNDTPWKDDKSLNMNSPNDQYPKLPAWWP